MGDDVQMCKYVDVRMFGREGCMHGKYWNPFLYQIIQYIAYGYG